MSAHDKGPIELLKFSLDQDLRTLDGTTEFGTSEIASPYSDICIVSVRKGTHKSSYFVKTPKVDASNASLVSARLRSEYEIMALLSNAQSEGSPIGVATPYAFYDQFPTIVTLAAKGTPLRNWYRGNARLVSLPRRRGVLDLYMRLCGAWLKDFQSKTSCEPAKFDVWELLDYCSIRLKMLTEGPAPYVSSSLSNRIVSAVQTTAASSRPLVTAISGRHNDFASHNIIAHKGQIRVIDFSMFDHGSTAYDPCNFWLELEMLKCDWTYSAPLLSRMQAQFLQSYGAIQPHDPAFHLARVRYSLNRLLTAIGDENLTRLDTIYRRRSALLSYNWLVWFAEKYAQ